MSGRLRARGDVDVVVVGAGLAGLSCARAIVEAGRSCLVLEASDGVGGRVRSDLVDGFVLDRGFQILLTAYPEVAAQLDVGALALCPFDPGAVVRTGGRFVRVGDPLRRPRDLFPTLTAPVGTLADKLRLVRTIRTRLGARSFTISDEIHNFGQRPAPITLAYHFNIGHPLLHEDAELRLPEAPVRCYDEASERDAADRLRIAPPSADAAHNVYHHMLQGDGPAAAAVVNPSLGVGGIGLYIRFDRRQLPVLNTWKHMGVGDYVLGIEPGTARIVDRPQLRAAGELPEIAPGETRRFDLEVGVLEGRAECDAFRA